MRSDQDQPGTPPRRSQTAPVPGMPYRLHPNRSAAPPVDARRGYEFIESPPMADRHADSGEDYNSWVEQGWDGGDAAFPVVREYGANAQEQRYFKPMPDLSAPLPDPYAPYARRPQENAYPEYPLEAPYPEYSQENAYPEYPQETPYPEYSQGNAYPEYSQENAYPEYPPDNRDPRYPPDEPYPIPGEREPDEPDDPPPMPPQRERGAEPWRMAVILSCVAGLLFCGVEIYSIAQNIVESEAELRDYRAVYLTEHNEDFSRNAEAVALRPAGETYPPTASPVPVVTPTPTPRIAQNDPLIAAMSGGGLDAEQSVSPVTPTPARITLERYPDNPLLIIRDDIAALREENEDIIARLTIDGVLSELVVQQNNTYYLNHSAIGTYSGYGAVFADENLSLRTPPENILLYGRTSTDGKVFAPLKSYISQGINFAGQHAFLSLNTMYEEARYVVFAVIQAGSTTATDDYFDYTNLTFATDAAMLRYAEEAISRSQYRFKVGILPTDRLLTLVGLSDGADMKNIIIVCRMLRDGESDGLIQAD